MSVLIGAQNEDEGPADILDDDLQQQLNEMADYNSDKEGQEKPSTSQADAGMFVNRHGSIVAQYSVAALPCHVSVHDQSKQKNWQQAVV